MSLLNLKKIKEEQSNAPVDCTDNQCIYCVQYWATPSVGPQI